MKNHVYMVNFRRICGEQLIIPSGCVMTDALTPTFSAEWDGLSVMAVFCRGGAAYQVTATADGFVVPAEIAHNPGAFAWGYVGYIIEDDEVKVRISTEQTRGVIIDGAYSDTSTIPEPIEPSVWEQLVAHLGDYNNPHRVTTAQIGAADAATVDRIEQTVSDQEMAITGLNSEIRRVDGVATDAAATASAAADGVSRLSGVVAMVEQTAAGAEQTAQGAAAAIAAHEADTANPHGVTAAQAGALPITGGSLQGNLHVAGKISADNGFETIGEIEMNDHAIKGVATPVNPADAATKGYVDGLIGDLETATQAIIDLQESYIGNGGGN